MKGLAQNSIFTEQSKVNLSPACVNYKIQPVDRAVIDDIQRLANQSVPRIPHPLARAAIPSSSHHSIEPS
jgi:hypothetical protein